jgi:ligand-binding sensor domain-containing protein
VRHNGSCGAVYFSPPALDIAINPPENHGAAPTHPERSGSVARRRIGLAIMLGRAGVVLVFIGCCASMAQAVDPNRRISQYAHASWRMQDGLFTGSPTVIVQTTDGYLWLGTDSGLLRFDGVRFVPWQPDQGARQLPTTRINDLLAARDGSLWIATIGGLSRWKDRTLTNYRTGFDGAHAILEDHNGEIWFTTGEPSPICHIVERETRCLGSGDGVPPVHLALPIMEAPRGTLWFGGSTTLVRRNGSSQTLYRPGGLKDNRATGFVALAPAPDDTVWAGIAKAGASLGLQRLVRGQWQSFKTPQFDGDALDTNALRVDREGSQWVGTLDRGLYRVRGNDVEHFDHSNGLSSDYVSTITEDQEGNLWVTTSEGVDRFSDTSIVTFSNSEGLCSTQVDSVLASRTGELWASGDGGLSRIQGRYVSCLGPRQGLPGVQVTSLFEDHAGRLWVGADDTLSIYDGHGFRRITRPDGSEIGFVNGIAEDADHHLWVAVSGTPRTVMQIDGGTLTAHEVLRGLATRRVSADPTGGIWLGLLSGDLAHYRDGKLVTYKFAHDDSALMMQILVEADGSILAGTTLGLIGWHNGKQLMLSAKNGLPCGSVNAVAFDVPGNLWLFMDCALGMLSRADLETWKTNPDARVSIRTLDVFDGFHSGMASFAGGARSSDGRLWFAASTVLQMLDPARLRQNVVRPPVYVEQVVADRKVYRSGGVVQLPPLTRDLEIEYVGLSFVAPQKVRFRYRLEGRDDGWQEPGTRRQAFYTDLRPGHYRFHVIAANNTGVWNDEGAALEIVIAAAWYQTHWFLVGSLLTGLLAIWGLYRPRLRQIAHAVNVRFDERLAERTRVAREIHDTLLQTVQGTKLIADHALNRPGDAGLRHAMEQVSDWLGQATTEGRAAINALRTSMTETSDLVEAFRLAFEDSRRAGSLDATFSVTGTPQPMHSLVRDELYRIGYEAIRNACMHSGGSLVDVTIGYGQNLVVRVVDNGTGIDPATIQTDKPGHFGLPGMRERAARIGATLTIIGTANSGTEVVITVPGRIIFRKK